MIFNILLGCNLPSGRLSVEVLSQKDRKDLKLIAELDPEFVAASFIGTAEDVRKVRKCLEEYGNPVPSPHSIID